MPPSRGEVVIGIETDRGLFVTSLLAAGYQVFAVNPLSVSRYRDRHASSGEVRSGDAKVRADLVRTARDNHRPAAADSDLVRGGPGARPRAPVDDLGRRRQANQLRSVLREFYPAALAAFGDLTSADAIAVFWRRREPPGARGCRAPRSPPRCGAAAGPGGRRSGPRRSRRRCGARSWPPRRLLAAAMGATVAATGRGDRRDDHADHRPGAGAGRGF